MARWVPDCCGRSAAAPSACSGAAPVEAAAWATPEMFDDASVVPAAACYALQAVIRRAAKISTVANSLALGLKVAVST